MPAKSEREGGDRPVAKKKSSTGRSSLRNVVAAGASTDTLIDLIERLGLVDIVIGRVKSRIEETDLDDLFDEIADYMRRNPEVLVVTLGALTVTAGLVVWMQSRKEWDGSNERRGTGASASRVRRAS
jgi:hypothetical protein